MNKNGDIDKIQKNFLEKWSKINNPLGKSIKEKRMKQFNINNDGHHYKSYRHIME